MARVLVVATEGRREAMRSLLNGVGEAAFEASIDEALESMREQGAEMIVLALPLPQPVPAALRRIAVHPVAADLPVVVVSPTSDEGAAVECLELGAEFASESAGPRQTAARLARALFAGRKERVLSRLAQTDALTGLANFGALRARMEQEFKRANRYEYPLSMVMIDLDYLKRINDRFGHEVGNRSIQALAAHLRRGMRETDFAARFGGDEFVLLLPYQTPNEAQVLVERLREGLKGVRVPTNQGGAIELSISAGVAGHSSIYPKRDSRELLLAADAALYAGKAQGRDRVIVYEGSGLPPATEASPLGN